MTEVESTGSGNWASGGIWSGGVARAGNGHDVVIKSGHNVTISQDEQANSITIESGGTLTSSGERTITIDGEGTASSGTEHYAFKHDGTVSGDLNLTFTYNAETAVDFAGSGNVNHVTINHADADVNQVGAATMASLTITAGIYDAGNDGLTVTVNTLVDGTLTGNNSTLTFGTDGVHGSTEGGSLLVNSSGTFTFGSGDVTVFGGFTAKGTEGSPNVTSTGGGDILIKGRTNNGFMNSHNHQGTNITGDYIIDYDNNSIFDNRGGVTIACGNFIVKHDGRTYEPWNNAAQATFKIVGNMQIQDGAFDTEYSGQNSQHLTVTGDCIVGDGSGSADTAVLTGNASTISLGSLVINSDGKYDATSETTTITSEGDGSDGSSNGFALDKHASGTFAHNSGTLTVTTNTNTVFRGFEGTDTSGTGANALNNLIVNLTGSATYYVRLRPNSGTAHTILNDVTVTQGKLEKETNDHTLTINGDVNVGANGTLGHADKTGNDTFGSITISGGGTFNSTSGTTTIKNRTGGGYSWYAPSDSHVYNHNNGKTIFDLSATLDNDTYVRGNYWYDLEIKLYNNKEWRYSDIDGEGLIAYNDFTITSGRLKFDTAGDPITVHGLTKLETNGQFGLNSPSGTHTFHGLVTLNGGTWFLSSGTNNMAGIRNVGGTIS